MGPVCCTHAWLGKKVIQLCKIISLLSKSKTHVILGLLFKIHKVNQESSTKQGCFNLKQIVRLFTALGLHLHIKIQRKIYPKVVGICEDLFAQSRPLLGYLSNLWKKNTFQMEYNHSRLIDLNRFIKSKLAFSFASNF